MAKKIPVIFEKGMEEHRKNWKVVGDSRLKIHRKEFEFVGIDPNTDRCSHYSGARLEGKI